MASSAAYPPSASAQVAFLRRPQSGRAHHIRWTPFEDDFLRRKAKAEGCNRHAVLSKIIDAYLHGLGAALTSFIQKHVVNVRLHEELLASPSLTPDQRRMSRGEISGSLKAIDTVLGVKPKVNGA